MYNIFTVDLEDWYQGLEGIEFVDWHKYENRLEYSLNELLLLLEESNSKATFFSLGFIADNFPHLITEILNRGHEIGAHGYYHNLIYKQTPEEFETDLKKALNRLSTLAGQQITSYRAPFFSMTKKCLWAINILARNGIKYDSSIFPVFNPRYGISGSCRFIHTIKTDEGLEIKEVPLSTVRVVNINFPIAGGAYLRILPYSIIKRGIKKLNDMNHPGVAYIHPWELDPEHPKIKLPFRISWTHYINLDSTKSKLKRLLNDFRFTSIKIALSTSNNLLPQIQL